MISDRPKAARHLALAATIFVFAFCPAAKAQVPTEVPVPTKASILGREVVDDNFGKLPTYVKADSLTVNNESRVFAYSGNVEVKQGDMILTCDSVEGSYGKDNKIKEMTAKKNVTVIKGPDIRATGQKGVYDAQSEVITLTGSPELQEKESVLTADVIKVFLSENRSVAEGAVRVKLAKKQGSAAGATDLFGINK